jgi:hypothetical protein
MRIVDDGHCYAYWSEKNGAIVVTGALFEGLAS